jgi:SlyX protein
MTESAAMSPEEADARLVAIETAVAHLQHDVEQLHGVVLSVQTELRAVQRILDKLTARVDRLGEEPEVRTPESEQPPHY